MNTFESSTTHHDSSNATNRSNNGEHDVSAPPSPFSSHILYLTGIPTAPVIGYHPKDKTSLALFDPLLQPTTNRSPTKVITEEQQQQQRATILPSVPILTEKAIGNTQGHSFLHQNSRALSNPKKMLMNTNFHESDYPEPPSPPPMKARSNLMISPNQLRKEMMSDNNITRMKKKTHKKSASLSDLIISRVTFDSSIEQDCCHKHNNNNHEKTPPRPRYRKRSTPFKLERDNTRTHSQSPTKFGLRSSSNWFRSNTDKYVNFSSDIKHPIVSTSDSRDDVDDDCNEDDEEQLIGLGIEDYEDNNNTSLVNDLSLLSLTPSKSNSSSIGKDKSQRINNNTIKTVVGLVDGMKPPVPTSFLQSNDLFVQRSSEQHPSDWQKDLTNKYEFETSTKLCQFMESYHRSILLSSSDEEHYNNHLFEMKSLVGCSRADLQLMGQQQWFDNPHNHVNMNPFTDSTRPSGHTASQRTITMLLNCGSSIKAVRGYFSAGDAIDYRRGTHQREVIVLEQERQFICVFRAESTPTKSGKFKKQQLKSSRMETIELTNDVTVGSDVKSNSITVFKDIYMDLRDLKVQLFALLDKLTDENPFYDVIFCGHDYASGLATLAAYKYASSRPSLRVGAYCTHTAMVKVGFHNFRLACHSLPNLKILRLEDTTMSCGTTPGCYVGHTLRIKLSSYKKSIADIEKGDRSMGNNHHPAIRAYKFGYSDPYLDKSEQKSHQDQSSTRMSPSNTTLFRLSQSSLMNRTKAGGASTSSRFENETISNYVHALEIMSPQNWVTRFTNEDVGTGVRGEDNESRELA